jgi:hypothetical protein
MVKDFALLVLAFFFGGLLANIVAIVVLLSILQRHAEKGSDDE